MLALADAFRNGADWRGIPGLCWLAGEKGFVPPQGAVELPGFAEVSACTMEGKRAFADAFMKFVQNQDPVSACPLVQKIDNRWLVHNRPSAPLEQAELDGVHAIRWMLDAPPSIRAQGKIRALDTIRFGVTTHRGCYGECRFCAIAVHQGRRIVVVPRRA
jgi:radical SAM superfamily enzyme YgiQ (UPF0313 family)